MPSDENSLHRAIFQNDYELVQMLLNYLNVNQEDHYKYTPLSLAVYMGNLKMVQLLLDNEAKLEIPEENFYPVHLAIQIGSLEIFKLLLKYKANLHEYTLCGSHCIHLTAEYGRIDILGYLLELGVNVNCTDLYKHTPLHRAIFTGKANVVLFLIEHNANVNAIDKQGNSPLHFSARLGLKITVELLICNGAKLTQRNFSGWTPLDFAASNGHLEIAKYLYEAGANYKSSGKCKYSPLHLAAEFGFIEIIEYFVNNGADVDFHTENNYTLLHAAIRNNHPQLALFLMDRGADVNSTTITKNYSSLDFAARAGNPSIINILIQKCASFSINANGECRLIDLISQKFSHDSSESHQQKYRVATEVIIKFLALRNRYAPIFLPESIPFLKELRQFWCNCKRKLETMDHQYVANSTISQYKLLQALFYDTQLETYLHNEGLSIVYNNLQTHIEMPPMYNNIRCLIKVGVARGRIRKRISSYAHCILAKKITTKLPPEIITKISKYLTIEDFINLATL